jgi:thiosulfate/3-mercaptopyruvate sulfurtransferase
MDNEHVVFTVEKVTRRSKSDPARVWRTVVVTARSASLQDGLVGMPNPPRASKLRRNTMCKAVLGILASAAVMLALASPAPSQDPWAPAQLITPEQLAKQLSSKEAEKPTLIDVAFRVLYESAHIPASLYFGPGRDPSTIESLKDWAKSVPRNKNIVIYCGCCPWDHCPNVRPAFQALKEMGFTHLRVVEIPNNLGRDWIDKGYPIEKAR